MKQTLNNQRLRRIFSTAAFVLLTSSAGASTESNSESSTKSFKETLALEIDMTTSQIINDYRYNMLKDLTKLLTKKITLSE